MSTLRSNGQAIMFYSCDLLLLFRALIFEAEERCSAGHLQDVGTWCDFITQIRWGLICIPSLHFEGQKSANFAAQLGDGAILKSYNFKTMLQMQKLK